jgi:predicted acetyltransferase
MELVAPSIEYESSYKDYINELGDEERYPFPLDFDHNDFDKLLAKLSDFATGKNLPDGYVQSSTFWLVSGKEILGVSNIRHLLNEAIEYCGGHIGLGVRPSRRRKGVGHLLMELSIKRLHSMGVNPIHIHCYKNNLASSNTIKACGGVLKSEINDKGVIVQRFLVTEFNKSQHTKL